LNFIFIVIKIGTTSGVKDFVRNDLFLDFCPGKAQDIDCSSTNELGIITFKNTGLGTLIGNNLHINMSGFL